MIKTNEELYELFVERYDVGSFRQFSLLESSNSLELKKGVAKDNTFITTEE